MWGNTSYSILVDGITNHQLNMQLKQVSNAVQESIITPETGCFRKHGYAIQESVSFSSVDNYLSFKEERGARLQIIQLFPAPSLTCSSPTALHSKISQRMPLYFKCPISRCLCDLPIRYLKTLSFTNINIFCHR
jgi:hypothetical protein